MYWYVLVCTILPDPVQGYRIPDEGDLKSMLAVLWYLQLDQHLLFVTKLPLHERGSGLPPVDCEHTSKLQLTPHNAVGGVLQKLALTNLLQYREYENKYAEFAKKYVKKYEESANKYADQYAKYTKKL